MLCSNELISDYPLMSNTELSINLLAQWDNLGLWLNTQKTLQALSAIHITLWCILAATYVTHYGGLTLRNVHTTGVYTHTHVTRGL